MSLGKWVREPRGPVYTNLTCPTLPDFKNCQKYGKDPGHLFWPDGCDLPLFSPERFLAVVRGKRLAFIGDSLARNQMDSLLCLLSQAETPTDVYRDALDRFRTWHFPAQGGRAGRSAAELTARPQRSARNFLCNFFLQKWLCRPAAGRLGLGRPVAGRP